MCEFMAIPAREANTRGEHSPSVLHRPLNRLVQKRRETNTTEKERKKERMEDGKKVRIKKERRKKERKKEWKMGIRDKEKEKK